MRYRPPRVPSHRECSCIVMLVASGLGPLGRNPAFPTVSHIPVARESRLSLPGLLPASGSVRRRFWRFSASRSCLPRAAWRFRDRCPTCRFRLSFCLAEARLSVCRPDCLEQSSRPRAARCICGSREPLRRAFPACFPTLLRASLPASEGCVFPFPFSGFPLEVPVRSSLPTPESCASIPSRASRK